MGLFDFLKKKPKAESKVINIEQRNDLDVLTEMLLVLFDKKTITKVKDQLKSKTQKIPIDSLNMNFRLFLSKSGNINLELLAQNDLGMYFKPIGFFEMDNNLTVTLLKEFENSYETHQTLFDNDIQVKYLTLKENAFIAAGSRDIISTITKMFNSPKYNKFLPPSIENFQSEKIVSNGLTINVKTSMMGALETILDDDFYELDDSLLIMYQNNNGVSLHSVDNEYNEMVAKDLMSAFKSL
jgi:hypothetical protein